MNVYVVKESRLGCMSVHSTLESAIEDCLDAYEDAKFYKNSRVMILSAWEIPTSKGTIYVQRKIIHCFRSYQEILATKEGKNSFTSE